MKSTADFKSIDMRLTGHLAIVCVNCACMGKRLLASLWTSNTTLLSETRVEAWVIKSHLPEGLVTMLHCHVHLKTVQPTWSIASKKEKKLHVVIITETLYMDVQVEWKTPFLWSMSYLVNVVLKHGGCGKQD